MGNFSYSNINEFENRAVSILNDKFNKGEPLLMTLSLTTNTGIHKRIVGFSSICTDPQNRGDVDYNEVSIITDKQYIMSEVKDIMLGTIDNICSMIRNFAKNKKLLFLFAAERKLADTNKSWHSYSYNISLIPIQDITNFKIEINDDETEISENIIIDFIFKGKTVHTNQNISPSNKKIKIINDSLIKSLKDAGRYDLLMTNML